ncbi:uncharacterized protein LOC106665278 [Cimex lectularius]|uniref:Poly(A) RNA polymerase mitochondrial-like central palm domain-containing protein n=1 Tax=Cimex lectularius TaxID=79782 RepID=A0A8I6RNV0_CIMLE|nr:uncharacterized protein LOC106665278 [Cimex lectularius]
MYQMQFEPRQLMQVEKIHHVPKMLHPPVILPGVNAGVPVENKQPPKQRRKKTKGNREQEVALPMITFHKENFDDQSVEFCEQVKMDAVKYAMIDTVLNDVAAVYRKLLPGLVPQLYGSSYTGIAFKNSDIDVHLHCHGDDIPDDLFIKTSGGILRRSPKFRYTIKVANAKVPVMKTIHQSGIELDISATSQNSVHNSILIKHIMDSDVRIKRLTMLISYWAKRNLISGRNLFTSYSIVLLVIFYLQKIEPPMLPPLRQILYRRESIGWPYAVRNDAKLVPYINKSTLSDLYKGFFYFYYNKDFSKVVISLYAGTEISLEDLSNYQTLSSDFNSYKRQIALGKSPFVYTHCIHVQDPIELYVNTTRRVIPSLLRKFQETLKRFVTNTSLLPNSQWLPIMTTEKPIELQKPIKMYISYPKDEITKVGNFNQDFNTACKLLLFNVEVLNQNKFQKLEDGNKRRPMLEYSLSTDKYLFTKDFRVLFNNLTNGLISCEQFKHKLQESTAKNQIVTKFKLQAMVNIDMESLSSSKKKVSAEGENNIGVAAEFVNGNQCEDVIFAEIVHWTKQYINPLINIVRKIRKGEVIPKITEAKPKLNKDNTNKDNKDKDNKAKDNKNKVNKNKVNKNEDNKNKVKKIEDNKTKDNKNEEEMVID